MSATSTPSDARPAARRTRWAPRWLVLTHRYLGAALGLLMLLWCLSGFVMMFVSYPKLAPDERAAHLPKVDWSHCCVLAQAAAPDAPVRGASLEMLAGTPVLRLRLAEG